MASRLFFRGATFERAKVDKDKRTVPVVFSSETPVDRWGDYNEVLDHGAADMSRMKNGAPLLSDHDPSKQIGIVESADIDNNGDGGAGGRKGRAVVRFSRSPDGEREFQDVQDGIRTKVSVGYERTSAIGQTKDADGKPTIRFAWTPQEISLVSIEADPNTGVGRSLLTRSDDPYGDTMKRNLLFDPAPANRQDNGGTPTNVIEIENRAKNNERNRQKEINAAANACAKQFPEAGDKFRSMAEEAIAKDHTIDNFNAALLASLPGVRQIDTTKIPGIGLSDKQKRQYSLVRGVRSVIDTGRVEGFEKECHQEVLRTAPGVAYQGFLVPADIAVDVGSARRGMRMAAEFQRDLNVTTANQGGDFVQTTIYTPIIEILRNRMFSSRLGVQTLSGLQGNVAIPRQTGAATAYSVAESAPLTISTQAINQVALSPKRIGAYNQYTKQLLLQSSVDVENFIRDDLMKVLAIKLDSLIINGQGANSEPTGVLNTTGVGTVTFGASATWAKVILFETTLALANADIDGMAYVTDPSTRGTWKAAVKVSGFPSFLWENATWPNTAAPDYGIGTSSDGVVNGYRAVATNQVNNNKVFFGNWADMIQAMWGGFDVVVNPYTLDINAEVRITVNAFIDQAIRHAASFCVSTDAGNQ